MTSLLQEYERAHAEVLAENDVTDFAIINGGKHKKLCFAFNGQTIKFIYPASPSDKKGVRNSVSDLRKAMGVKRVIRKNPDKKPKRKPAKLTLECPKITTKPDPFESLKAMEVLPTKEDYDLEALIDRAGREQVFAAVLEGGWRSESVVPHQVWREAAQTVLTRAQRTNG